MSKVAMILSVFINAGNASTGGDSITIVDDMKTCKRTAEVYMSTKKDVQGVTWNGSKLKFRSGGVVWGDKFEIVCRSLEDDQNGF